MRPVLVLLVTASQMLARIPTARAEDQTSDDARAEEVSADDKPTPKETAQELHGRAVARFRAGEFRAARDLYEQAYRFDPHPDLVYMMARSSESLHDLERAVREYTRYLKLAPKAADRGAVKRRIALLRKQIGDEERLKRLEDVEPWSPSPIPWVIAGIGVVGLGVGVGLGVVASQRYDAALDAPNALEASELEADARTLGIAANVCFAVGGAVALGGAIAGIVDLASGDWDDTRKVSVRLGPTALELQADF
jgi:tetratricopeptide (TPR) repeat protein